MTLNVDAVYTAVDSLIGGTNIATLLSDAILMVGLFFLGRAVMHTGEYRPRTVRLALSFPTLLLSMTAIFVSFWFIDRGHSTTQFMADFGAQLETAIYSIINFTYCGVVVTTMLILAARQYRNSIGIQRLPAALLFLGSASGVALCLDVIVMDIAHVSDQSMVLYATQPAYSLLSLLTFMLLCTGFASQPAIRRAHHLSRARRTATLAVEIEPLWERATQVRPGLSQAEPRATSSQSPEAQLHRKVVEIRDAEIDSRATFTITENERLLLQTVEQHLLGHNQPDTEPDDLVKQPAVQKNRD